MSFSLSATPSPGYHMARTLEREREQVNDQKVSIIIVPKTNKLCPRNFYLITINRVSPVPLYQIKILIVQASSKQPLNCRPGSRL